MDVFPVLEVLEKFVDDDAVEEWKRLKELMKPLAVASAALPPSAVRTDPAAAVTLARFIPGLLRAAPQLPQIMAPYSKFMDANDIKHPFIRNWMEVLCFLLSGAPASGTLAAEIGQGSKGRPRRSRASFVSCTNYIRLIALKWKAASR